MQNDKLILFSKKFNDKEITRETAVNNDLELTGDDTDFMPQELVREFKIDLDSFRHHTS